MNKIVYNLVYNRKRFLNAKGTALVQVEVRLNGKKKYFSTNVYLRPEQWDKRRAMIYNHPNADALNHLIYGFMNDIERKELALWRQGIPVSLDALKAAVEKGEDRTEFAPFFRREVHASSLKESTKRNHLTTLALLLEFRPDVTFADLTFEFISAFGEFLQNRGYHTNTIAKHMKQLKRHINTAINKEYMDVRRYPFRKYKIKTVENHHTFLTPEELASLETLHLEGRYARYRHTLDAFLFCCYAGMRYSDFVRLSPQHILFIRQQQWLVYRSEKTGTEVRLPLYLLFDGKGTAILKCYEKNLSEFFHLPDNSNVNKELDVLSRLAGLKKHISFHTARHTNATLLTYSGVNITTVQRLLGHRSVKTTQLYANVMDMTVVHDLERNNWKLQILQEKSTENNKS